MTEKIYHLGRVEKDSVITAIDYAAIYEGVINGTIPFSEAPTTEELINNLRERWYIKLAIRFNKDIRAVFNSVWVD